MERTDFVTAHRTLLDALKSGKSFTINGLARETNLNFRTVKKILEVLEYGQSSLSDKHLDISYPGGFATIQMQKKRDLTLYPEKVQRSIIRTYHYPTASRDEEILAFLFLKDAVDKHSAVWLEEDKKLRGLVYAEHVVKDGKKFYLTVMGRHVANGALKLYPELGNATCLSDVSVYGDASKRPSSVAIMAPPNEALIKKKLLARRSRLNA